MRLACMHTSMGIAFAVVSVVCVCMVVVFGNDQHAQQKRINALENMLLEVVTTNKLIDPDLHARVTGLLIK